MRAKVRRTTRRLERKCVQRRGRFTREVLAAIPVWLELGARPSEIAAALGTSENSLRVVCSVNGLSLRPSVRVLESLTPRHLAALSSEATRRGVPIWRLIQNILIGVADYNLFSAVLGDYDDDDKTRDRSRARARCAN